ncbi:hypothetical protein N7468_010483 [Penicillium chermesinum]|uniref:Autophagy-related protein n=1 Tax=Penicillium chermesinum TaxID=63820 RepID=A0A9W9TA23_9EURO|nr:uncharacterized protein N7468_010483 [Penicillium chermesinum]KAJ5214804.1 hypothetical protein N7468_010483 [Penicillium chermesinum]
MSRQRDEAVEAPGRAPSYPGDDPRLTSKKELAGWYGYGWAAEVFPVCAMSSFLPITLEQMARDRGVLLSDKSTPCSTTWSSSNQPNHPPGYGTGQCIVFFLGAEVNTASFALYTFSVSVLVQAVLIISMSGAADHGSYRKTLLVLFGLMGSIATMSILLVSPRIYLVGALLAIIANTCFGASFVLLNSFLPLLVRHHPLMVKYQERPAADGVLNETSPLIESTRTSSSVASIELNLSTRISSFGVGIGYIGAVTLQIIAIVVVVTTHQTTFSLRLVLFLIGLWWFIFTIPASLWLRSRPGPPLLSDGKPLHSWTAYMAHAWKSLGKTVMRARRLKDILLFLAAWFLLSDGIATVSGTAVLFAKTELGMKPAALGLINVIVMVAGVCGAFSWSYMSSFFRLGASQTIIACILLFELIPLYGILGFSPSVQRVGLGLQQPWEMYPLGAVYGLVMAAFYALYAITDKGSSIFGPAIVGFITDRYGGIRPAFIFLAVLIFLPLPLMLLVDVERGKQDALELGSELDRDIHTGGFSYDSVPTAGRCEGDIGETLANP